MQSCPCSKWVHLKCSLLFSSKFNALDSSHLWSCPPCSISASPGCLQTHIPPLFNLSFPVPLYEFSTPTPHLCQCSTNTRPSLTNILSTCCLLCISSLSAPSTSSYVSDCSFTPLAPYSSPDSVRVQ